MGSMVKRRVHSFIKLLLEKGMFPHQPKASFLVWVRAKRKELDTQVGSGGARLSLSFLFLLISEGF